MIIAETVGQPASDIVATDATVLRFALDRADEARRLIEQLS